MDIMIEIKELDKDECKLKRIHRRILNNAKLNQIVVEIRRNKPNNQVEKWHYDFTVLMKSKLQRWLHFYAPFTVKFWAVFNTETCVITIGNVDEKLFEPIYTASKLLFNDIDDLTVIIEKDYCD